MSDHPSDPRRGERSGPAFTIRFGEREVPAWPGETVAGALIAAGIRHWRNAEDGSPRGLYCGIGTCWECRLLIDGEPGQRACRTLVRPGLVVRRQEGLE